MNKLKGAVKEEKRNGVECSGEDKKRHGTRCQKTKECSNKNRQDERRRDKTRKERTQEEEE